MRFVFRKGKEKKLPLCIRGSKTIPTREKKKNKDTSRRKRLHSGGKGTNNSNSFPVEKENRERILLGKTSEKKGKRGGRLSRKEKGKRVLTLGNANLFRIHEWKRGEEEREDLSFDNLKE